jgi:hypothetical protein
LRRSAVGRGGWRWFEGPSLGVAARSASSATRWACLVPGRPAGTGMPARACGPAALASASRVRHTVVRPVRVATVQPPATARTVRPGHAAATARATAARRAGHECAGRVRRWAGAGPAHQPAERGRRATKSRAIWSNLAQRTPSWPEMCSINRSSIRSTCGRPETSGWIVNVNTA